MGDDTEWISPEVHARLLRRHFEGPLSPIDAADRCGITLTQLARWYQSPGWRRAIWTPCEPV